MKRSELNSEQELLVKTVEVLDDIIHDINHGGPGQDYGLSVRAEHHAKELYENLHDHLAKIGFNFWEQS